VLAASLTMPLQAQIGSVSVGRPARLWASAWAGMYTTVDAVGHPGDGAVVNWAFDDYVPAFGAGAEYEVSQGLMLGLEGSYASTDFVTSQNNVRLADGTANLLALFATGRLQYGGTGAVGFYLKGMAGLFGYRMPEPDETNFDPALSTGAGLQYPFRFPAVLFLEWSQLWAYHEKDGIDEGNTGRHSLLRLGFRVGL